MGRMSHCDVTILGLSEILAYCLKSMKIPMDFSRMNIALTRVSCRLNYPINCQGI